MSILIRGMEKPTSCTVCPFNIVGRCLINWTLENQTDETHSCPLVQIPPHGRLIDADALDDILADQSEDAYNRTHAPRSWERALSAMRDYLDNAPTIIEGDEE